MKNPEGSVADPKEQKTKQTKINMKLNKIVAVTSLAAVVASSSLFAGTKSFKETVIKEEAKPAWNASLSAGWDSAYMFRGVNVLRQYNLVKEDRECSISWSSASFTYNLTETDLVTVGGWMGTGLGKNSYREFDLPVNYAHTIGDLTLGAGYQLYTWWTSGGSPVYQNEVSVSAAYAIKLGSVTFTPSATYYYNLGPDNDGSVNGAAPTSTNGGVDASSSFLSLRLDSNIPVLSNVSLAPYVGYNVNFSVNTKDSTTSGTATSVDNFNGGNNVEYGLAIPVKINSTITISGYVAQSIALENLGGSTRQCTSWGGAKVTFSF